MRAAGTHHQHFVAGLELALHHPHQRDHAQIIIEPRVDNQGLQFVGITRLRRRNAFDNRFQHIAHIQPGLGTDRHRVFGIDANHGFDFFLHLVNIGGGQINLIEHRHHFQTLLHRRVAVGHRLRFHALCGIHHQQCAFAGGQRAADFVAEVHMAGGVDEIQKIGLPIFGGIGQRDRLRLDGDAALALDGIGVQHLRFHLARLQTAAQLDDAIGQGGLAVIDMGNDGEVADKPHSVVLHGGLR